MADLRLRRISAEDRALEGGSGKLGTGMCSVMNESTSSGRVGVASEPCRTCFRRLADMPLCSLSPYNRTVPLPAFLTEPSTSTPLPSGSSLSVAPPQFRRVAPQPTRSATRLADSLNDVTRAGRQWQRQTYLTVLL